jgi:HEPN domain-containing protein
MKTKSEYINFWVEQSNDDWRAVQTLFKGKNYLQSLFFAHLVMEKLCKSLWIKHNSENVPPRTHNLMHLLSSTPIKLTEDQSEFLLTLNRFQLEGRYPDYLTKIQNICTKEFTASIINSTNEFRIWLLEKLQ